MKNFRFAMVLFIFCLCFSLYSFTITYQGKILDSTKSRINGNLPITFSIYTEASGATPIWTESYNSINITNGLFNVDLGSITPINLLFDTQYYLGININNSGELSPRSKFQMQAYSVRSIYSDRTLAIDSGATAGGVINLADTLMINNYLTITKNGNIGIGTNSPKTELQVEGTITANSFKGDGSQLSGINYTGTLPLSSITGDTITKIEVLNLLNNIKSESIITEIPFAKITGDTITKTYVDNQLATKLSTTADTYIADWTKIINKPTTVSAFVNDSGFITSTNPVFIGNVSIGDSMPNAKLAIKSSGNDNSTIAVNIKNSNDVTLIYIDDSGNIGIGTASPSYKLDINGAIRALNANNKIYAVYAP